LPYKIQFLNLLIQLIEFIRDFGIFGQPTTVIYSDHNPLTYITESSTKSAKLMKWLPSLQSYNVTFKYKEGRKNVVADCLSRLDSTTEWRWP